MGYKITPPITVPGLGGWTYQGDVSLGDPPVGSFYVDQTSMSSGSPTIELNVTDANSIDHSDWLQDLVLENHLVLRNRAFPADSLVFEISSNTPGAGFRTLVGAISSGNGTFRVGSTYDLWSITTSDDFVVGPASSIVTSIPTFSDTTGKVVQNNTTLQYDTGEVQLASATAAVEIQERNTPPSSAVAKGHVWVRDDAPNALIFTDDDGVDHSFLDFVVGPASSSANAIPTFNGATGKKLFTSTDFFYASGELQLTSATASLEIQERNLAPTFAANKGHIWVKDDAPNILTFTDDTGVDHPIVPPNSVVLGEWTFASASLGVPSLGEFNTDNATLALITAIRFRDVPNSGQSILNWSYLLPQQGILYFQDISDPGGTSVTFPYDSLTFPIGGSFPQFNAFVGLSVDGTVHGTNWSANDYSVQVVPVESSLASTVSSSAADNDVTVLTADPIIFRDNAVNFTVLEIVSTNATATTPSIKVTKATSTSYAFQAESAGALASISISPTRIVPKGNTTVPVTYYLKPANTTSGSYSGVNVWVTGGAHTGSLRGGNLTLEAGASTSGTDGSIVIGTNSNEVVIGSSVAPGFTLTEGTDHPVAPAATKAQLWVKSDYSVPATDDNVVDGQVLMMTDDTGLDIELSWLAANYKTLIGANLAFSRFEEQSINAGGTQKLAADTDVSYCYDHLSNMWYQAFIKNSTADAYVTSSSDGGYTWVTSKIVDTSIGSGDLAQPCTNGTKLGVAADGNFYLSTTLSATNLPGTATGSPASITGSTGLVWSVQASLWVMCGDNAVSGYIYTSPDGITWTDRTPAGMTTDWPVSMDIAHTGFGPFNGTERIMISCGTTSTSLWYSTNGGVSWTEDTTSVPTVGLQCIMWCPSPNTASTFTGLWMGIESVSAKLWISTSYTGTVWYDTGLGADHIFRTAEFAGWSNTSTNTTWLQISTGSDTSATGVGYTTAGTTWQGNRPLFASRDLNIKARYQWGNGVIMFDRFGDSELVIGRYGPIKP